MIIILPLQDMKPPFSLLMSWTVRHQPNIPKDVPGNSFLGKNFTLNMLEDEKVFQLFSILKHLRGLNKITENETFRFFLQKATDSFSLVRCIKFKSKDWNFLFSDEKEKRWEQAAFLKVPQMSDSQNYGIKHSNSYSNKTLKSFEKYTDHDFYKLSNICK